MYPYQWTSLLNHQQSQSSNTATNNYSARVSALLFGLLFDVLAQAKFKFPFNVLLHLMACTGPAVWWDFPEHWCHKQLNVSMVKEPSWSRWATQYVTVIYKTKTVCCICDKTRYSTSQLQHLQVTQRLYLLQQQFQLPLLPLYWLLDPVNKQAYFIFKHYHTSLATNRKQTDKMKLQLVNWQKIQNTVLLTRGRDSPKSGRSGASL